jgi:hypothetical protein
MIMEQKKYIAHLSQYDINAICIGLSMLHQQWGTFGKASEDVRTGIPDLYKRLQDFEFQQ